MEHEDIGTIAEVPERERLDADGGVGSDARGDGDPPDDLRDLYADPGEVVEEDLS